MRNRDGRLSWEDQNWLTFFALAGWFVLSILFLGDVPKQIIYAMTKPEPKPGPREFRVLLENPPSKKEKEKKHRVYLSTQDAKASGQLTRRKGFEALSDKQKLAFAKKGEPQPHKKFQKKQADKKAIKTKATNQFHVRLFQDQQKPREKGNRGQTKWGRSKASAIPSHYRFRDRFAFSWDRNGEPRIPTRHYKHYTYFKKMMDKIRSNWAPPGGMPAPLYDDSYHRMNPTPGAMRYSAFPSQDVRVVFAIAENGDVIEVRIWQSLGYRSLDTSCVEAIERSRNFGPPPAELVEDDRMIVPMVFRIVVR